MVAVDTNGSTHRVASFLPKDLTLPRGMEMGIRQNDGQINWVAPNNGAFPLAHISTFQAVITTAARTYRESDEAVRASLDNARNMRNDCGVMECLEARQRCTALLNWHVEPEDDQIQSQRDLASDMTRIIKEIPRFTEYKRCLQEAIWYGKAGIQNRLGWQNIAGKYRVLPSPRHSMDNGWLPIHGDKLVFRFDDGNLEEGQFEGQMGIRVGIGNWAKGALIKNRWKVEATERGLAYFLSESEQRLCVVHKHMIEDSAFEDVMSANNLHGVGIRSRIYWEWFQKQACRGFLMEYLERSAGGIELWSFPAGNDQAKEEVKIAATTRVGNQRNVTLVPIPAGDEGHQYGVQIIEPGMAGIDCLKDLLEKYFGHRIKRYILGQTLTSEADATGLGSGVADLHLGTFLEIIRYDATNLEETITRQLLRPLQQWNFPKSRHIRLKFVIDTQSEDSKEKMEAYRQAWEMGAGIKEKDVMQTIGSAMAGPTDAVLRKSAETSPQPGGAAGQSNPFTGEPGKSAPSETQPDPAVPGGDGVSSATEASQPVQKARYSRLLFSSPFADKSEAVAVATCGAGLEVAPHGNGWGVFMKPAN